MIPFYESHANSLKFEHLSNQRTKTALWLVQDTYPHMVIWLVPDTHTTLYANIEFFFSITQKWVRKCVNLNKSQKSSLSTHGIKELIFTEVSSSPFPSWIYKNTYMLLYLMKILNHLNLCTKCTSQYKIEAKDSVLKWELGVARTFTTGWNMRPNQRVYHEQFFMYCGKQ